MPLAQETHGGSARQMWATVSATMVPFHGGGRQKTWENAAVTLGACTAPLAAVSGRASYQDSEDQARPSRDGYISSASACAQDLEVVCQCRKEVSNPEGFMPDLARTPSGAVAAHHHLKGQRCHNHLRWA